MSDKYFSSSTIPYSAAAFGLAAGSNIIGRMKRRNFGPLGGRNKRGGSYTMTERIPKESAGFHAGNINSSQSAKTVTKSRPKSGLQKLLMKEKMNESSCIFRFQGINPKNPFTQMPKISTADEVRGFFELNKQWTDATLTELKLPIYAINLSGVCSTTNSAGTTLYTKPMYRLHKRVLATAADDQANANYTWTAVSGQSYDGIAAMPSWMKEKINRQTATTDKYFYENVWTNAELAFYMGFNGTKAKIHTSLVKFTGNQGPKRYFSNDTTGDANPTDLEQHNIDLWWTHFLDRHLVGPLSNTCKYESKKPFIETSKDCTCLAATSDEPGGQHANQTNFVKRIFFKDNSLYKYNRQETGELYSRPNILTSLNAEGYPISNFGVQEQSNMAVTHVMQHRMSDTWLLIKADYFGTIHTHDEVTTSLPLTFDLKIRCKQIYNNTN